MKIYFMKQKALDYMKANINTLYVNYYRNKTNQWIYDLFDYDPFEFFIDIPDFKLASLETKKGELDLENCKILYKNLMGISESQASDERLWAGLCNGVFYGYLIKRWDYNNLELKDSKNDASTVHSRFFFKGKTRAGLFRNSLAKYWWVGQATYQKDAINKFELLDALGPEDFSSKISDLFYSNTFASNLTILSGICKAWKMFSNRGIKLTMKEHFRPALQYLNALGGGILLDILSEDEIKAIFFDYAYQLYNNKEALAITIEETDDTDNEDEIALEIDSNIQELRERNEVVTKTKETEAETERVVIGEKNIEDKKDATFVEKLMGAPTEVVFGCTVIVQRKRDEQILEYNIPKTEEAQWFTIQKILLGKSVNDDIRCATDTYTVVEIKW